MLGACPPDFNITAVRAQLKFRAARGLSLGEIRSPAQPTSLIPVHKPKDKLIPKKLPAYNQKPKTGKWPARTNFSNEFYLKKRTFAQKDRYIP